MTRLQTNEKGGSGIGVLGAILLFVLVVVVVVLGLVAYKHFHKSANIVTSNVPTTSTVQQAPSQTATSDTAASQTTSEKATGTTLIKFKELGIQVTVPNTIDDLVYSASKTTTKPVANTALLTTTTLGTLDAACGLSAANGQGLGQLLEWPGKFTAATNPDKTSTWSKQFPTFYVAYNASAGNCSTSSSTNAKAASQISDLKTALATTVPIQK